MVSGGHQLGSRTRSSHAARPPVAHNPGFCGEIRYDAFCTRPTHTNQTDGIAALQIRATALRARTGGRGMDGIDCEKRTGETESSTHSAHPDITAPCSVVSVKSKGIFR